MSLRTLFGKKEAQPAAERPDALPPSVLRGRFLVTAASSVNNEYSWQGFWMTGVLTAPGMKPSAVLYEGRAHSNKWPEVGQTLPVTIAPATATIIEVLWAEVPDPKAAGLERAREIVDSMNRELSQGDVILPET